jgi:hypothetical protein
LSSGLRIPPKPNSIFEIKVLGPISTKPNKNLELKEPIVTKMDN